MSNTNERPLLDDQPRLDTASASRGNSTGPKPALLYTGAAVAALVLGSGSFFAGMQFQKAQSGAVAGIATGPNGQGGQFGGRFNQNGVVGQVTAISASSITVDNRRTGAATTYAITSSTAITNNGSTATAADIAVGDRVFIEVSTSDSNTAARIMVGGGFGGPGGNPNGGMPPAQSN